MMQVKQHNEVVAKLLKQIDKQQSTIKTLNKQLMKSQTQIPQIEPSQNQQILKKKINQINKQYKDKIFTITQQLRNKSTQIKDLKQRLTARNNMQIKQKNHVQSIVKKTYDRKPSSAADHKISALVTHYEAEITKKVKFIQNLQKQIHQYETTYKIMEKQTNENSNNENEQQKTQKGISLTQHQKQINKIKLESQKYKKMYEQKDKQFKDIMKKYNQLTKQYYKLINSYGISDNIQTKKTFTTTSTLKNNIQSKTKIQTKLKRNALDNLLQQMLGSQSQLQQSQINKHNFNKNISKITTIQSLKQQNQQQIQLYQQNNNYHKNNQNLAIQKLQQILLFLQIDDPNNIITSLQKWKIKIQQINLLDTISRSLQAFFYNIGKGRVTKQDLINNLDDLKTILNKHMQSTDILDQICIQVGAKRDKIIDKLKLILHQHKSYLENLKSIRFTQQLSKGNKVIEFIQFFQLDKQQLKLPIQLTKIQEQLKQLDKFIKQSRQILQISQQCSNKDTLQLILRYLQKTISLTAQLQKKPKK